MTRPPHPRQACYGFAALAFALAATASFYACGSDDSGGGGSAAAGATTGQGGGGHAAQGGSTTTGTDGGGGSGTGAAGGGTAGSGQGGSGGAPLSSAQCCMSVCEAMVQCPSGAGGGGGAPSLDDCLLDCYPALAPCSSDELYVVLGCVEPAIDPDCDEAAFFECANTAGCIDNG